MARLDTGLAAATRRRRNPRPAMSRPASQIEVKEFRQIFHWPLSLQDPSQADEVFQKALNGLSDWGAPLDGPPAGPGDTDYREAVYFHDFVQDFLYPIGPINTRERLQFKRDALIGQEIRFTVKDSLTGEFFTQRFTIEDLSLDLFRFGSAVITFEIVARDPTSLARVQTLIDFIRRAYPGFWGDHGAPGLSPLGVQIGTEPAIPGITSKKACKAFRTTRMPALFEWWRLLAGPNDLEINTSKTKGWRHVLDERIPVMSCITLTPGTDEAQTFERISEGDWHRITGADEAGSAPMPYNTAFLREQSGARFYDRFMPDVSNRTATRHCFAGYHYALVGAGGFFESFVTGHFRSHYRQMVFIAHLEFATMLTFSRRITDLVASNRADFSTELHNIRRDFLEFRHRFQFTDVSNHLQAREMNAMLRRSIGLEQLCRDVEAEITAASEYDMARDQQIMAREQQVIARSQTRLTQFATIFLPASLASSFAGMNVLAGLQDGAPMVSRASISQFFGWNAVAFGLAWLCLVWIEGERSAHAEERALMRLIGRLAVVAALIWGMCGPVGLWF